MCQRFVSVSCNTSSFEQNVILIFTPLRTKGLLAKFLHFFCLFGVFALAGA